MSRFWCESQSLALRNFGTWHIYFTLGTSCGHKSEDRSYLVSLSQEWTEMLVWASTNHAAPLEAISWWCLKNLADYLGVVAYSGTHFPNRPKKQPALGSFRIRLWQGPLTWIKTNAKQDPFPHFKDTVFSIRGVLGSAVCSRTWVARVVCHRGKKPQGTRETADEIHGQVQDSMQVVYLWSFWQYWLWILFIKFLFCILFIIYVIIYKVPILFIAMPKG